MQCLSFIIVSTARLKLGNACYHSVQNLLSSRLLTENLKIKIYRTIILPVVLYRCETWSLTLGKRPLGRPRHRWEDNIKLDLQEVGGGRGDWMELAQDMDRWRALVFTARDFRVP